MATASQTHAPGRARVPNKDVVISSPAGDRVKVSISAKGKVSLRSGDDLGDRLGVVVIDGFTYAEASKKSKGFWGRLWDKIKSVARAVVDVVTFDLGGASCRPDVNVTMKGGRFIGLQLGISCTN